MLSFFALPLLAQTPPALPPKEFTVPQTVRALPGGLDRVPVFNSNSPELVQVEGILLSSFPPQGKQVPSAHLNLPFRGAFDIFAHHIAKAKTPEDLRTLYLGVILHNPGSQPVTVDVLQAASYLSQPDAPFIDLPASVDNPAGTVYAGPGSRAMDDILRGKRQSDFPAQIVIPPGQYEMVMNLPIPVKPLTPPLNGRSSLVRLWSSGPVYVASLARFANQNPDGSETAPSVTDWQTLLQTSDVAGPRDRPPTPMDAKGGKFEYGRVAGMAIGSRWQARITDASSFPGKGGSDYYLTTPQPGEAFSYGLSLLKLGTFGTGQDQTAEMVRRYPDTAYRTHGNYAIEYNLTLPLQNSTDQPQTVAIAVETPIKEDQPKDGNLRFFDPLPRQIFFRGTVRLRYTDDRKLPQTRYVHLVQRRGQQGQPLVVMQMPPGDRRLVQVDFLYPPDATPPQVLTIRTLPGS